MERMNNKPDSGMAPLKRLSLLAVLLLAGCGGAIVNGYTGENLPDDKVATIFTPKPYPRTSAHAQFVDELRVGGEIMGNPRGVKVLPGVHQIRAVCYDGSVNRRAFPSIRREFLAGRFYELQCVSDGRTASLRIVDRGTDYNLD